MRQLLGCIIILCALLGGCVKAHIREWHKENGKLHFTVCGRKYKEKKFVHLANQMCPSGKYEETASMGTGGNSYSTFHSDGSSSMTVAHSGTCVQYVCNE